MKPINRVYIPPIPVTDKELAEVTKKNLLVTGPHLEQLAEELKMLYRKKYCVLTVNASSALLLSMLSLQGRNRKVLMPATSTCFSFVNATLAAGLQPVFGDVDLNTANLNIGSLKKLIRRKKIDLVISPNHFGIISPVGFFKGEGLPVIEDAAQSALSSLNATTTADVLVLSFYPTKVINGVDGGALLTDDKSVYKSAADRVYYHSQYRFDGQVRFNMRMPNLHAFLALKSLEAVEKTKQKFDELYAVYDDEATKAGFDFLGNNEKFTPFRFVLKFKSKKERNKMAIYCRQQHIYCGRELLMIAKGMGNPNAKILTDTTLAIPFHVKMGKKEIQYLFKVLKDGYKHT